MKMDPANARGGGIFPRKFGRGGPYFGGGQISWDTGSFHALRCIYKMNNPAHLDSLIYVILTLITVSYDSGLEPEYQ